VAVVRVAVVKMAVILQHVSTIMPRIDQLVQKKQLHHLH